MTTPSNNEKPIEQNGVVSTCAPTKEELDLFLFDQEEPWDALKFEAGHENHYNDSTDLDIDAGMRLFAEAEHVPHPTEGMWMPMDDELFSWTEEEYAEFSRKMNELDSEDNESEHSDSSDISTENI